MTAIEISMCISALSFLELGWNQHNLCINKLRQFSKNVEWNQQVYYKTSLNYYKTSLNYYTNVEPSVLFAQFIHSTSSHKITTRSSSSGALMAGHIQQARIKLLPDVFRQGHGWLGTIKPRLSHMHFVFCWLFSDHLSAIDVLTICKVLDYTTRSCMVRRGTWIRVERKKTVLTALRFSAHIRYWKVTLLGY